MSGDAAAAAQRDLRPRPCDRQAAGRRPAAQRPQLHRAGQPGARRRVPAPPAAPLPRINGGRPRTNEYLFDGISVLQPEPGQVAFFPNVDAIQEFTIESNSPPAEFGRFNGGVVNLTTKAGQQRPARQRVRVRPPRSAQRPQLLRVRHRDQAAVPTAPVRRRRRRADPEGRDVLLRRLSGPAPDDRPDGDLDGADRAPAPGRLHRGDRRARAGDLRPGDDDQRRRRGDAHGLSRQHDSSAPASIRWPGACSSAIRCRPALARRTTTGGSPTRASTRTRSASASITTCATARDQAVRARDALRRDVPAGHAFAGRQRRRERRAGAAADAGLGDRVELSAHVFSERWLHELRVGDTRRSVDRAAAAVDGSIGTGLGLPGIPSTAPVPNTLPTFLVAGYQQLGSPPNTATDFGTSVTADRRRAHLAARPPHHQVRRRSALGAARTSCSRRRRPAVHVQQPVHRPADADRHRVDTGTPFASFLLGQVQQFSIDLQQQPIRNRAHIQEYFVQDDWRVASRSRSTPACATR